MTTLHPWRIVEVIPLHDRLEHWLTLRLSKTLIVLTWLVLIAAVLRMSWPSEVLSLQASDPEVMAGQIHQLELRVKELEKK